MNMMLFAILGAFVGAALTAVMPGGQRLNIVAGALTGSAGALLGGWLLVPLFHASAADEWNRDHRVARVGAGGGHLGLMALATRRISR